jgi:DNA excision repair protein ERCC-6
MASDTHDMNDASQHRSQLGDQAKQESLGLVTAAANEASTPNSDIARGAEENLDEESAIKNLAENVRDQADLERDITFQANAALVDAEDKRDEARIDRLEVAKKKLETQLQKEMQKLRQAGSNVYLSRNVQKEITRLEAEIEQKHQDIGDFKARMEKRRLESANPGPSRGKSSRLHGESHREYLIRIGKITPFANIGGERPSGTEGKLANVILEAEEEAVEEEFENVDEGPKSHQILRRPGFAEEPEVELPTVESEFSLRPRKKRRVQQTARLDDEFEPTSAASEVATLDDLGDGESDGEDLGGGTRRKGKPKASKGASVDFSRIDDGIETMYQQRLADWVSRRSKARARHSALNGQTEEGNDDEEWFKPAPEQPDLPFTDDLKIPGDIHPSLFAYQKTGVQWLAELYSQNVGGIIGDEMGLGKTGQSRQGFWF